MIDEEGPVALYGCRGNGGAGAAAAGAAAETILQYNGAKDKPTDTADMNPVAVVQSRCFLVPERLGKTRKRREGGRDNLRLG